MKQWSKVIVFIDSTISFFYYFILVFIEIFHFFGYS